MNRQELINAVAARTQGTKQAADSAMAAVFESIRQELAKGGKVQIIGFGSFEVRTRKERQGRNPKTGEAIEIAAANHPFFSAGKALKEAVNAKK